MKKFELPVTLLGAGLHRELDLIECLAIAPNLVVADGGIDKIQISGLTPKLIVGDFDSIKSENYWEKKGVELKKIDEQDSTDFQKCLYFTDAPIYLAVGFTGLRSDHFLAVCSEIAKNSEKKVIIVDETDIILNLPKEAKLNLESGIRFSLFPLVEVKGISSTGLKWPINGIRFSPNGVIGTSNETNCQEVKINITESGMLVILPRVFLKAAINCLNSK